MRRAKQTSMHIPNPMEFYTYLSAFKGAELKGKEED
jgi:hypothetical protein